MPAVRQLLQLRRHFNFANMNQDATAVCSSQNPSQQTLSTISPTPDTRDSFQDAPSTSDVQLLLSDQSQSLPRTEFHSSHPSYNISSAPSDNQTDSPPVSHREATPPDQSLGGGQMPASGDQEPNESITPTGGQTTTGSGSSPGTTREEKEWRSWKIHWAYILAVLTFAVVMIVTLAVLLAISHRKSGFARETNPPSFLVRHPRLRKAVWEQGILYVGGWNSTLHRRPQLTFQQLHRLSCIHHDHLSHLVGFMRDGYC